MESGAERNRLSDIGLLRLRHSAASVIAALMLLASCDSTSPTTSPGITGLPVPVHAVTSAPPGVLLVCRRARQEGVLAADPRDPRRVWLEAADGRLDLNWPPGFRVVFGEPSVVIAPDGTVVAQVGRRIQLGGGLVASGDAFNACIINGRDWLAPD
jgi:hypothetical protein